MYHTCLCVLIATIKMEDVSLKGISCCMKFGYIALEMLKKNAPKGVLFTIRRVVFAYPQQPQFSSPLIPGGKIGKLKNSSHTSEANSSQGGMRQKP